jgi:hypothetical protein
MNRIQDFLRKANLFFMNVLSHVKRAPKPQLGKLVTLSSRQGAEDKAISGHFVVVAPNGHPKWAMFKCPCGCNELVALNLMQSQHPCWSLESTSRGYSLHPSVDSQTCGAHYWVRDGQVKWC